MTVCYRQSFAQKYICEFFVELRKLRRSVFKSFLDFRFVSLRRAIFRTLGANINNVTLIPSQYCIIKTLTCQAERGYKKAETSTSYFEHVKTIDRKQIHILCFNSQQQNLENNAYY